VLKKLSIYLELKAREKDDKMGSKYKDYINNLFNKIKVKLLKLIFIGKTSITS
jgi:hypothetical protein